MVYIMIDEFELICLNFWYSVLDVEFEMCGIDSGYWHMFSERLWSDHANAMLYRRATHDAGRILVGGNLCVRSVCILRVCGVAHCRLQSGEGIDCAWNTYSRYYNTIVRDTREFIYLMRLYCGWGLAENTVYLPVCFPRPSAGMLAGHNVEVYDIYLQV